jgi:glycosyltransferase involved in cell wall biosynthesis
MELSVLHLLSQRPLLTGSGTTLDAMIFEGQGQNLRQAVVVGVPHGDSIEAPGGIDSKWVYPLSFERAALDFPVPGMSDVMPYRSTCFSDMNRAMLDHYLAAWTEHLNKAISDFQPDVIHSHHLWWLSALVKDVAPHIPVVSHCHGTGLRQFQLCPHWCEEIAEKLRRNDAFVLLHRGQLPAVKKLLEVDDKKLFVVGAGYRQDVFNNLSLSTRKLKSVLYAGKLSRAKGVLNLLDAAQLVSHDMPDFRLHIAGSGEGEEADEIMQRIAAQKSHVIYHGHVNASALASLMNSVELFVLPSFYEGLPLVLVEAIASGCRVVATDLPGIRGALYARLKSRMRLVDMPAMRSVDQPEPDALGKFTHDLAGTLIVSLKDGSNERSDEDLEDFTWNAVYQRVHRIWRELVVGLEC